MTNETLPNNCLTPTGGHRAPAALAAHAHARVGRRGATRLAAPAFVVLLILISLCVTHGAPAKPADKVTKLRADKVTKLRAAYALDKSVEETDGALIRRKLLKLLSRKSVRLFLKVIRKAEAGEPDLMVGGCRSRSLKKHPALVLPRRCCYPVKGWGCSYASGNYQLTLKNWKKIAPFLGLHDFSEENQALAALELIRRGGGAAGAHGEKGFAMKRRIQGGFLSLVMGDVDLALCAATYDWASSSCSTLPAGNKVVYARLADQIRKSEAALKSSERAAEPGPGRVKAQKQGRTAVLGRE